MVVPAAIYAAFNAGGAGGDGWGIPMATDIAFAVGVVTLLGKRVPLAAKIFLLTLAVADDIGAIVVIAVFYTGDAVVGLVRLRRSSASACIFVLRRSDVQSLAPYLAVGAFVWLALLESGVHATLAGVALGLLTPAWPLRSPRRFPRRGPPAPRPASSAAYYDRVLTAGGVRTRTSSASPRSPASPCTRTSPLERLERALSPWVALRGRAGLRPRQRRGVAVAATPSAGSSPTPSTLGVLLGLVVGKTVGVFARHVRRRASSASAGCPTGTTWRHMLRAGHRAPASASPWPCS